MISLEDKLLHFINIGDQDGVLDTYYQIIAQVPGFCGHPPRRLRSLKNYLTFLNGVIYMNCRRRLVCIKKLTKVRKSFLEKIESQSSLEDLVALGEDIVTSYLSFANERLSHAGNPIIHRALDYIKRHLSQELSLEEVAQATHVSKSHLSNLFSKCLGNSFSHHVNKLRIEKAKELLATTEHTIMEVAAECGFNSQSYFCTVFNGFEGMTPNQYRRLIQVESGDFPK